MPLSVNSLLLFKYYIVIEMQYEGEKIGKEVLSKDVDREEFVDKALRLLRQDVDTIKQSKSENV